MPIHSLGWSPRASGRLFPARRSTLAILAGALIAVLAAGCASPGEPVARKPPIPQPVANLAASQSGNSVLLAFTLPQDSVAGAPLENPPTIELYRDFEPVPQSGQQPAAPKHPTPLATIPSELVPRYVVQGQFRYADQLSAADFANHPNEVAVYSVRARVSSKKLSAPSNIAALRVYPAADPITDLMGQVTPTAVVLRWTPPQQTPAGSVPPIASYRVYRAEAQQPSDSPGGVASAAASPTQAAAPELPAPSPGVPPPPPVLNTPLKQIGEVNSPGFTDANIQFGKSYVYSVRSVIDYSGATIESSDSNFLAITPRDTFPPAAPKGVIGIFVPAAANVTAYVDLSWAVNPEPDLAGYRVYRSEQAGVQGTPLTAELLLAPAFRDMNVLSGHRYFYTVTAVDRSGNQSAPSAAASVNVP